MIGRLAAIVLAAAVGLATAVPASAHCDGLDGPVAKAAQHALDTGNVNLALPYAPASAEAEITAKFVETQRVRKLGADARALADMAFIETVVRLHRIGEGASYTGVRPAGVEYGPMIPAAERALQSESISEVRTLLIADIDQRLSERLAHFQELRNVSTEPKKHDQVSAARQRISAELGFITYAEGLRQSIVAGLADHEE
jgi:hypothetical protein